jgi:hypothetical protein
MTTATAVGYVEMRIAKVVGLGEADDEPFHQHVVLEELSSDRQLAIAIGHAEAFSLAARLGGITWRRPMTYQFAAALVQALGGRSGRCGSSGWWRTPISPPSRSKPTRRPAGRRTARRRAEPRRAGPGTDLRRPRGAATGGGQTRR